MADTPPVKPVPAPAAKSALTDKARLVKRLNALKSERSGWLSMYQELSDYIMPFAGRFYSSDRNRAELHQFNDIIDATATESLEILAAGLMGGLTSPARPWFRLGVSDPKLRDNHEVKVWLADCQRLLLDVFAKSNTYLALHHIYRELGLFGTSCAVVMDDFDKVVWLYTSPVGEFCLAGDFKGKVNTLYRQFQKTVGEVVREFGYENCSVSTRQLYDQGSLDSWVDVYHVIEPRDGRDPSKLDGKNKAYRSTYFETKGDDKTLLRDSGFERFRVLAPRWDKTGSDIYGRSPGMQAIGAVKQLQMEQLRKGQAIDQLTRPSLQVPSSLKNQDVDMLPGGVTYVDATNGQSTVRNLMEVGIDLSHLNADIEDTRTRIRTAFHSDLFLMLANDTRSGITATEVAERHEEKMLILGPVLERLESELLGPLIDIAFERCISAGILPEAPDVLHGMALEVEYISVLAQAQRMIATNGIDRWVNGLAAVSQVKPDVLDKFNADKWADEYADLLSVPPELLNSDDQVAAIRQARAQAEARKAQAEQLHMAADAAAKLGGIQTPTGNAATDIMGQLTGYGSPSTETLQ